MSHIYDPSHWRASRGSRVQFFATDDEVRDWLFALPDAYGPYVAWGSRPVQESQHPGLYVQDGFEYTLDEWWSACIDGSVGAKGLDGFFLHATTLVRDFPRAKDVASAGGQAWAAVNGLPSVQHGLEIEGRRESSVIAFCNSITNKATGETVSFEERRVIFTTLRRRIKASVKYSAIRLARDGLEYPDVATMTEAAAKLAATGYFTCKAGPQLAKR